MKPSVKAFNAGIILDSMRRNDTVTSKNVSFFQFLGHNVPINCSKVLGVRKEIKPLGTAFLRGIIHASMCRIDKVRKKRNFLHKSGSRSRMAFDM